MLYRINIYAQIRNIWYAFIVLKEISRNNTIISAYYTISEKSEEIEKNPVFKYGSLFLFLIIPDEVDRKNVKKYLAVQTKMISDILLGSNLYGIVKESTSYKTVKYISDEGNVELEDYAVIKFFPNYFGLFKTILGYIIFLASIYFLLTKYGLLWF
jgi:hypothetical protein